MQKGHWLSAADFLTAVAVGMLTPGPVMTAATFAGYLAGGGSPGRPGMHRRDLPSFVPVGASRRPAAHATPGQSARAGLRERGLRSRPRRHPGCIAAARLACHRRLGHHRHRGGKPCRPDTLQGQQSGRCGPGRISWLGGIWLFPAGLDPASVAAGALRVDLGQCVRPPRGPDVRCQLHR